MYAIPIVHAPINVTFLANLVPHCQSAFLSAPFGLVSLSRGWSWGVLLLAPMRYKAKGQRKSELRCTRYKVVARDLINVLTIPIGERDHCSFCTAAHDMGNEGGHGMTPQAIATMPKRRMSTFCIGRRFNGSRPSDCNRGSLCHGLSDPLVAHLSPCPPRRLVKL